MPWIICSQMVPILALAPIVIVVLGSIGLQGLLPKSIISAYLCFFPVTIGMVKGLTSPDPIQLDLMRTWSATPRQDLLEAALAGVVAFSVRQPESRRSRSRWSARSSPNCRPAAQAGIGARLLVGSYYGQTIQIWAALVAAAVLAVVLIGIVGFVERGGHSRMGARCMTRADMASGSWLPRSAPWRAPSPCRSRRKRCH